MRPILLLTLISGTSFAADLNIYTYDSFASEWGPGPKLEREFEAQCDCDIEFITAGDGVAVINRLKIEGDKTDADLVIGLDQNLTLQAIETGLFDEIAHEPQEIAGSGVTWDNPYFVAYDWGQFAFIYNLESWEEAHKGVGVPETLFELSESDFSVILENPRSSTPGLGMALWAKMVFGEDTENFWKSMKDNVITITPGWSEAYSLFLEGEADMVLSYTTSPAYHRIVEDDQRFFAAPMTDGHGLQIELAARVKSSSNKELADKFLEFLVLPKAQSAIIEGNWMYPVTQIDLPEGFDAPEDFWSINQEPSRELINEAIADFENGLS